MKVIEYILAFIVLMAFIPLFNIAIHSYYTVKPELPPTYVKDIIMDTAEKVIKEEYSKGNLTPEIIDISKEIADKVGSDIIRDYAYRLELYSSIKEIIVDKDNNEIIVKTLTNRTLNLLIVYRDSMQQISIQKSTMYRDGLYWYVITGSSLSQSIDNVEAIVAILESRTSMYVGYWFKYTNNTGYALNINNELTFAINSSTALSPINFFGNSVLNTTLIFYNSVTKKFKSYDYEYFDLIYQTNLTLEPYWDWREWEWKIIRRKYVYLNETYIKYIADYGSRTSYDSYTLYPFRVLRIDIPVEKVYTCSDDIYNDCSLDGKSKGDPITHYSSVSFPIYNALLFIVKGKNGIVYIPVYRQSYVFGEQYVPEKGVVYVKGYTRIGMFTYDYVLSIWRR